MPASKTKSTQKKITTKSAGEDRDNPQYDEALLNCTRCKRLQTQFKSLREKYPDYWNKPVPASGRKDADLLILGLAPGLHGANKTGQPFVGDASGLLLNETLTKLNLNDRVKITNIVKCLPIKNLPSTREISNCSRFLTAELADHHSQASPVVFVLGGLAHKAIIRYAGAKQSQYPFEHGRVHELDSMRIVDSYHCSRYNTQTKRLTPEMFLEALKTAADLAYP